MITLGNSLWATLAHLNLNAEYLPYKHIIGQLILEVNTKFLLADVTLTYALQKNNRVRTVVNKLSNINAQFRFFEMELIAGEPDFVVEHVRILPLR